MTSPVTERQEPIEPEWFDDPWDDLDEVWRAETEPVPAQRRFIGVVLAVLAGAGVVALLIAGAVGWWLIRQLNPPWTAETSQRFEVITGDTVETLSQRLLEEGFIAHAGVFRWYVERQGGLEVEPGNYVLRPGEHVGNLLAVLRTPPRATTTRVVFPEGFTVNQIGRRLQERVPGRSRDRFVELAMEQGVVTSAYLPPDITSLEGLLFPDTYMIAGDENELRVLERMVRLMERVGREEGIDESSFTPYEVLIIASMIEREAKVDEDRGKIARVIYNRLAMGMKLQIDATVYYGQDPDTPFRVLRERDTPHNTYLYAGLPATPIANPGRASIRAALNPSANPVPEDPICAELPRGVLCQYVYYVLADTNGRHAFAVTLEQHEANIQAAREAGVL
jgi:UPF0755 protein